MVKSSCPSMRKTVKQYWVVGRQTPTESNADPTCFRIRVFAKNSVLARSRFWYEMKRQNKVRKCQGEIVSVSEIFERKSSAVKNYGIVLKYLTRKDYVNMYKEYRDTSLCGAVAQMYSEMSGRHSARHECIHIIKTVCLSDKDVQRPQIKQFTAKNLKFPKLTQIKRAPTPAHKALYTATRPILI
jgi:large subunit ribosomal protein L18Ae